MTEASVREFREHLRAYLDRAAAGEGVVILRRGREVARLVPPQREPTAFPDLQSFRDGIHLGGERPGQALARLREDAR